MALKTGCNSVLLNRLDYLKQIFGVDEEIQIIYLPGQKGDLIKEGCRGRVEGSTIYIFEGDHEKAMETLTHEFLHYLLSESRNATIRVHNSDLSLIQDVFEAYRRVTERLLNESEERAVERIAKGLNDQLLGNTSELVEDKVKLTHKG